MAFSLEYVIDPKVCKTEEDPQEQLQLKVSSGHWCSDVMNKTEGYYLKIEKLQLLFVIMSAHYILMEIYDLIQISLRCTLKGCQPLNKILFEEV